MGAAFKRINKYMNAMEADGLGCPENLRWKIRKSRQEVANLFSSAAKAAGLGHRTPYELRHGGVSHSIANGMSFEEAQGRGR